MAKSSIMFSYKDYINNKNKPQPNPLGDLATEFQRLRNEYKKNPSIAKLMLLKSKQKKLAKRGIRIKI